MSFIKYIIAYFKPKESLAVAYGRHLAEVKMVSWSGSLEELKKYAPVVEPELTVAYKSRIQEEIIRLTK